MKVFLSWSGVRSRIIAERMRDWLPEVVPGLQTWISSEDLELGQRWAAGLARQLKEGDRAIACLTPENKNAPWVLYETGALSKQTSRSRICPYLHDLSPADLSSHPLGQFQCASTTKSDTRKLVLTLHRNRVRHRRTDARVLDTFDEKWPDFERCLEQANVAYIPPLAAGLPKDVKVLIVDDEASQRSGLAAMVGFWGMIPAVASEGYEALQVVESFHPDVMITDLNMPGLDGWGLLENVRKCSWQPVSVVLTAFGNIETAVKLVHELNAFWFLEKPIQPAYLEVLLRRAAVHSRLLQSSHRHFRRRRSGIR